MYKLLSYLDSLCHDREISFFLFQNIRQLFRLNQFPGNTVCLVIGPPRSGNTFALRLLRTVWPNLKFVTHIHSVAAIRQASKQRVKVVYLDRDIDSAVLSLIAKRHLKSFHKKILYNVYKARFERMRALASSLETVLIINFEDMIKAPEKFIEEIASEFNLELPKNLRVIINHVETSHLKDNRPANEQTAPNNEKTKIKNLIKEQVMLCVDYLAKY